MRDKNVLPCTNEDVKTRISIKSYSCIKIDLEDNMLIIMKIMRHFFKSYFEINIKCKIVFYIKEIESICLLDDAMIIKNRFEPAINAIDCIFIDLTLR